MATGPTRHREHDHGERKHPEENEVTRTNKAGALSRLLTPSPELAAVVGDEPLARTEIVKRLWDYIREHGCHDPADRRIIVADDKLRAVFGRDQVNMTGLLSPHLKAI